MKRKLKDFLKDYLKREKSFIIMLSIVLAILTTAPVVRLLNETNPLFTYPLEEYQALENEVEKIVIDDFFVNLEEITDKEIEYTIKRTDNEWNMILTKGNRHILVNMIKADTGIEKEVSYQTKTAFYMESVAIVTVTFIAILVACLIIVLILITLVAVIGFFRKS